MRKGEHCSLLVVARAGIVHASARPVQRANALCAGQAECSILGHLSYGGISMSKSVRVLTASLLAKALIGFLTAPAAAPTLGATVWRFH
jgi:hypothetical protein